MGLLPQLERTFLEHVVGMNWHHLPAEEVLDLMEVDPETGLDVFVVKHRQEKYGPNELTTRSGPGPLKRFLLQFHQPLIYILIAAGTITLILREWVDTAVIFGVVLVNAVVGYLQEAKAVQAIEALAKTMTTEATVLRGGHQVRVPAPELVPGDVVLLQAGDKVPADLRLFRSRDLQIDESALTGESVPVEKRPERDRPRHRSWPSARTWPTPRRSSPSGRQPASSSASATTPRSAASPSSSPRPTTSRRR